MRKETEPEPQDFSFEKVVDLAKETLLREGSHVPTVIAEGDARTMASHFNELGATHEERVTQMFLAGYVLGQAEAIGRLQRLFFISEGWMSLPRDGKVPELPPSQDPQRHEVLLISSFRVRDNASRIAILEMLRNEAGELVELAEFDAEALHDTAVQSPLLAAFVTGFEAASDRGASH